MNNNDDGDEDDDEDDDDEDDEDDEDEDDDDEDDDDGYYDDDNNDHDKSPINISETIKFKKNFDMSKDPEQMKKMINAVNKWGPLVKDAKDVLKTINSSGIFSTLASVNSKLGNFTGKK